jgi:L-iditol 2-dehydrogenase
MQMNALQLTRPRTFEPVRLPVPDLASAGPDRLLVRTRWVSLCGSDIPFFTGGKRFTIYPLAPGAPIHEAVGQVVESSSSDFKPGESVLAIPQGDRGLAEFFVAQAAKAILLPPELADADVSCIVQPLSTVMNAVDRLGDVSGRTVAVIGLGSIGLFFCWLLKKAGAATIVGIDPNPDRCRLARGLGIDRTINQRSLEVVHAARQDPSSWEPTEMCVEAVGHQMETLNDCFELVRQRGTVLAFGVPDQPVYAFEYETFFRKNLHLIAAVTPDWKEYLTWARDLFQANRPELEAWVTHRWPIREAAAAFALYERHEEGIVKAILDAELW